MLKLVQNEYVKLLKKKSTWAILIIVVLVAVGFCWLFAYNMSSRNYYADDRISPLKNQAEQFFMYQYNEDYEKTDENGNYLETTPEAEDMRRDAVYYRFILDNNLEFLDWRVSTGIVRELCDNKYLMKSGTEEEIETATIKYNDLKAKFDADDWKSYYEGELAKIKEDYKDNKFILDAHVWYYEYSIANNIKPGEVLWKDSAMLLASEAKISLAPLLKQEAGGETIDLERKEKLLNQAAVLVYRIEHNIEHDLAGEVLDGSYNINTMWGVFSQSKSMVTVIGVLIIVVAGSIVSSEFSQGTIKFLLINPVKRWKILVAKYITAISYGVVLLLMLYLVSGLSSMFFSGFSGVNDKLVIANNGVARAVWPMFTIIKQYLLAGINVVVMVTLAFALSSVARSSALAVSISMLLLLVGSIVVEILAELQIDWARYLIFANLNLVNIYNGNTSFPNQSFPFSVFIVAMHLIIFFMIAWDGFTRREV